MKALFFILLALAVVVLVQGATADEYFNEEDVEIELNDTWEGNRIDVPAGATFSIDIEVTGTDPPDDDNFTGVDIYLFTQEELDDYDDGEGDGFETLSPTWWENRTGIEWTKPPLDEDFSFFIVIDNLNNTRESDAVPNGTVTVDINWTVIEAEVIDPIDPGSSDTSDGDMTSFLILAVIVLAVMMGIGMAVRRGGSGGEGDDGDGPAEEKEDYFGRVRIG
jgi:hypothetical protein